MPCLLWIELDGFYISLHKPSERPLIIERDKLVLDANLVARQRGVKIGMEARQAKSLLADCVIKKWDAERAHLSRNRWLDICTEFSGVIEPLDQHIAAIDLRGHPNPLDVTEKLVRKLVSHTHLSIRYGVAPSVWLAQLAAYHNDLGEAMRSPQSFLSPLPVLDLSPVSLSTRNRLSFLGYRTIGEVAHLSLETLQAQFGEEAHLIRLAAQGRHYQAVHPSYPLDSVNECLQFEGLVEDSEVLDNGIKNVADRIGERLVERTMQGSKLSLKIETEDTVICRERRFTKPIYHPLSALIAMRLLLQEVIETPIVGLRAVLTDLEKTRHRQQELEGLTHRHQRPNVNSAIGYVKTVFGDQSVKLGSEIELPRRIRVLKEWQNATGWR